MLNVPRFKHHIRAEVVPGEGVFVLSGQQQTLLKGRLYELVVPCVGDGLSTDDLCDRLQDRASAAEIYFVLNQLEAKGFLCEQRGPLPDDEAALWAAQQIDPSQAARRLGETTVTLRSFGVDAGPLVSVLESARVRVAENGALGLVATDGYLRDELSDCNAEALRSGRPWMLVRPFGREIWIGPLFQPGVTGCWACLAERLRANRPVESYLASRNERGGAADHDRSSSPATLQAAWGLVAQAVATWVARGELPALLGKVQTFDIPTWELKSHTLVRLPYCPACGSGKAVDGAAVRPLDVNLESRLKAFTRDGGHRVVPPEVTLQRFEHHVSPITGAVSMLRRVGKEDNGNGKRRRRAAHLHRRAQPGPGTQEPSPPAQRPSKHELGQRGHRHTGPRQWAL